ncbi:DUF7350 domain-containing protein [Halomarina litorea]|uniref:DUF7350 domain-containing protein n=1 Tax=Halomarina litorea TaxID=2961595 RepID=UPI0020C22C32|nr:hypothetical protein [Halomarina sp. BCD28]
MVLRGGASLAGAAALSGCTSISGLFETRNAGEPPLPENRPDAVYYPSHVEGMTMAGMGTSGDYKFGLMYSFAHRFWNVNGEGVEKTSIEEDDSAHLMASVWDPETGVVIPETGLTVEISRDSESVSQETIYPMLSQPMRFHYGANFGPFEDGTYTATLSVGGLSTRRTGSFVDRFGEPTSVDIEFEYSEETKQEVMFRTLDEKAGTKGAVEPMEMEGVPQSFAPTTDDLPGRVVGEGTSNDVGFVPTVLDSPPQGIDEQKSYLAVSARTPYNRMIVPAMGLSGTLVRDGETVFEGSLQRTLDPTLNYHYGAVVDDVQPGDELTLSVGTQPQTARHEGYETAFGGLMGDMSDVTIQLQ